MHVYAKYPWKARNRALRKDKVVVLTGLSSKVCGVVLRVVLDEDAKTARMTAVLEPGAPKPEGVAADAVGIAAKLLAERARRALGNGWKIADLAETEW